MKITIEPTNPKNSEESYPYSTVSVDYPADDSSFDTFYEMVLKPALIAWGWSEKTIENCFEEKV